MLDQSKPLFSAKVMRDARRLVAQRNLEVVPDPKPEPPLERMHRAMADYKRKRDEALTELTLALVEVGRQVNSAAATHDPDDWFAA